MFEAAEPQSQLQDHAAGGGRRQHGKYLAGGRGERNKDVTNTFQQEPGDKGQGEDYPGQQHIARYCCCWPRTSTWPGQGEAGTERARRPQLQDHAAGGGR